MLCVLVAAAVAFNVAPAADEAANNSVAEAAPDERLESLERDNRLLGQKLEALESSVNEREEARSADDVESTQAAEDLASKNAELERRVAELEHERERSALEHKRLKFLSGRLEGYLDMGFFMVGGDGSGTRTDDRNTRFPEHEHTGGQWVYMGDPLSTMINARGDVADTGRSRAVDYDPIQSGNNPTFIVNTLNLAPSVGLGENLRVVGLIDFLPRGRTVSEAGATVVGDYVDIKLANLQWHTPVRAFDWDLFAGKIDSVFGHEYSDQEAPDRLTVTPSLMCRYTCGRPVGVSSRMKLLASRALSLNLALTNGNTHQEAFGTTSERETNVFKTATGRVAYAFPVGAKLEVGGSGMVGAEDLQPRNDVLQWQYGFDVHLDIRGFELRGEFIRGRIDGVTENPNEPCATAQCLSVFSAYGLLGYRITNWIMPVFRADWRDALHRRAGTFVYESELVRFSPGLRFEVGEHVIIKSEYTFNVELGRIPTFPNDVFTSSLIARF